MKHKALLLVGSPGSSRSNSNMVGQYLMDRLGEAGWDVEGECLYRAMRDDRTMEVLNKMDGSELVVLAFPLYVDSLPSQMIKFMEIAASHRSGTQGSGQRLMAICQSGFPESRHNDYALRICSVFAREAGFKWVGGLSVGGGGAIGGRTLTEGGGMLRNLRKALDITCVAMTNGDDVPMSAKELTNKGIAPPWLYNWIVNRSWKRQAHENGVDPMARPHS